MQLNLYRFLILSIQLEFEETVKAVFVV